MFIKGCLFYNLIRPCRDSPVIDLLCPPVLVYKRSLGLLGSPQVPKSRHKQLIIREAEKKKQKENSQAKNRPTHILELFFKNQDPTRQKHRDSRLDGIRGLMIKTPKNITLLLQHQPIRKESPWVDHMSYDLHPFKNTSLKSNQRVWVLWALTSHAPCLACVAWHLTINTLLKMSLVVLWLRICLPMQETWVPSLVREDLTCRGATKPIPQLLKPA